MKRTMPDQGLSEVAATANMAERMGPMQGVQPAANPMPTRNEPSIPDGFSLKKWTLLSRWRMPKLMIPIMWMPRSIMTSPPILRTMSWYSMKRLPRSWADEPNMTTNTVEKPRMNMRELMRMTFFSSLLSPSAVSSSKEMPVTNDI